ncbi:MAG: serine hydrolase domain-containing protein [Pseudomonadota bacterium]
MNLISSAWLALLAALFVSISAFAEEASLPDLADQLLDRTGAPGVAIARLDEAGLEIAVAGVRALGADAAIEPGDSWHVGSNTKAMTATLAARLVERGDIEWDATIKESLAPLQLEIAPAFTEVTLSDLLTHRSGLPANMGRWATVWYAGSDNERDVEADRRAFAEAMLGGEPAGERGAYLYSNSGYTIAGLMLELAAGASYETLMQREVFDPLDMGEAGWGPPGEADQLDEPRGHRPGLFSGLRAVEPGAGADNPPVLNSAGRAHMPLGDLARFLSAHLAGATGDERYLSAESWAMLHAPIGEEAYAMGWGVSGAGRLSHAGSNTMWFVRMAIWPEQGEGAIIALNEGRIAQLREPVDDALEALAPKP